MLIGAREDCVADATDVTGMMTVLRELEFDFLELTLGRDQIDQLTPDSAKEYVTAVERTGLPILSTSFGQFGRFAAMSDREREGLVAHLRDYIDFTAAIGADAILVATQENSSDVSEYAGLYREWLTPLADHAAAAGVTLALEHVGTYKPATIARLVRAIDHRAIRIYFDMGNCLYVGESPLQQARVCALAVAHLHIKGGPVAPLASMPLVAVREILQNAGFDGRGCLEIEPGAGNRPLKEARGLLKMAGYLQ